MNNAIFDGFLDIPGWDGLYQINHYGLIKCLEKDVPMPNGAGYRHHEEVLYNDWLENNYPRVSLCKNGQHVNYFVHRIVANVFVPNPKNLPYVNHIDGCTLNPFYENLEWCSQKENVTHSINILKKRPHKSKYIFNPETGIIYDSLKEACLYLPYSVSSCHLGCMLRGFRKNKTNLIFA